MCKKLYLPLDIVSIIATNHVFLETLNFVNSNAKLSSFYHCSAEQFCCCIKIHKASFPVTGQNNLLNKIITCGYQNLHISITIEFLLKYLMQSNYTVSNVSLCQ